uniref:Uncharacterized protein n=1 Tax=Anguilla anguilla TaxID=7936 RepID=A0A0E9ULW9_ANGAN
MLLYICWFLTYLTLVHAGFSQMLPPPLHCPRPAHARTWTEIYWNAVKYKHPLIVIF